MWAKTSRATRYAVALDLADLELRDALADALEGHPALAAAGADATPDLVITDHPDPSPSGIPALHLGGALPADASPELILSAAHLIAAGYQVAPAAAPSERAAPRLSHREREVLGMMIDGAPNKAIARALGITERTAKFHVAAVLAKLHARNRAEAVSIALREGLVVL